MNAVPTWTAEALLLLLVGAAMIVEPERFATFSENLGVGFRNFERSLRGSCRQQFWLRHRTPMAIPHVSRKAVRISGALVVSFALLIVTAGALSS